MRWVYLSPFVSGGWVELEDFLCEGKERGVKLGPIWIAHSRDMGWCVIGDHGNSLTACWMAGSVGSKVGEGAYIDSITVEWLIEVACSRKSWNINPSNRIFSWMLLLANSLWYRRVPFPHFPPDPKAISWTAGLVNLMWLNLWLLSSFSRFRQRCWVCLLLLGRGLFVLRRLALPILISRQPSVQVPSIEWGKDGSKVGWGNESALTRFVALWIFF